MFASEMRRLMPLAALLCLLLSRSAGAQEGDVIAMARPVGNATIQVLIDDGKSLQLDADYVQAARAFFADTEWTLRDTGKLFLSKEGTSVFGSLFVPVGDYFWLHLRTAQTLVSGTIHYTDQAKRKGTAELFWTTYLDDGRSRHYYLWTQLSFVR